MKLILCSTLLLVFVSPLNAATVIDEPSPPLVIEDSSRIVITDGADIGDADSNEIASEFKGSNNSPDLDINGGIIRSLIRIETKNSLISIKGGMILGVLDCSLAEDAIVEIFGKDLVYAKDPGFDGGTITGTLADGTALNLNYSGKTEFLRLHNTQEFEGVAVCRGPRAFADRVVSFSPGLGFDEIVPNLQDTQQVLGISDWIGSPN